MRQQDGSRWQQDSALVDLTTGVVTVTKVTASQDSGPVSNPDGLRNQMEGRAMQGMSRALFEEVKWNDAAGECTITTVGSAIGNAIFDAIGVRIRQVPFTPARVLAALTTRGF